MNFPQFLAVLRARWQIVLGIFSVCTLASLIISIGSPELYTALASVVVDAHHDPLAAGYGGPLLQDEMQTQTDIVTSQRVAERAVRSLRLDQDPALKQAWQRSTGGRGDFVGWLASGLQKGLTVPPRRDSTVINISVRWSTAKDAAKIANAFAQAYIDTNIELKVQPAKQYATWFDERSRALRADLEAKQKVLSDYRDQKGLIASDERVNTEMARLGELSSELVKIQSLRQDSQSRELQGSAHNDESIPEILQSPLILALKSQLSQAEAKEQLIATQVGTGHPDYQRIQAEITSLRDRILRENARVISSFHNTTLVNMRREKAIADEIEIQKKRLIELNHQIDHAAILQNDVVTAQRNFDAVSQGLAQTSLESQARQANVALLTRATEPAVRSSPKYLLNFSAGISLGIVLGIGAALLLEMLDQRVRKDAPLAQLLGVPMLARISSSEAKKAGMTQFALLTFRSVVPKALRQWS